MSNNQTPTNPENKMDNINEENNSKEFNFKKLREVNESLQSKVNELNSKISEYAQKEKERNQKKLEKEGKYKELLAQREQEMEKLKKDFEAQKKESFLSQTLQAKGLNPKYSKHALRDFKDSLEWDENGKPTNLDNLLEKYKTEYSEFFVDYQTEGTIGSTYNPTPAPSYDFSKKTLSEILKDGSIDLSKITGINNNN